MDSLKSKKNALDKLMAFMDDKEAEKMVSKIPGITIKITGAGAEDAPDTDDDQEPDAGEGLPDDLANLIRSKKKVSLADMLP